MRAVVVFDAVFVVGHEFRNNYAGRRTARIDAIGPASALKRILVWTHIGDVVVSGPLHGDGAIWRRRKFENVIARRNGCKEGGGAAVNQQIGNIDALNIFAEKNFDAGQLLDDTAGER